MTPQAEACTQFVLGVEGGYVNDPNDPGGATNHGITMATLAAWRRDMGHPAPTAQDVQDLSVTEAEAIYGLYFWNPIRADGMPPGVDLLVFDQGVLASPRRSVWTLQQVIGLTGDHVDGWCGDETLGQLRRVNTTILIDSLARAQLGYLASRPGAKRYMRGWTSRVNSRQARAHEMANLLLRVRAVS